MTDCGINLMNTARRNRDNKVVAFCQIDVQMSGKYVITRGYYKTKQNKKKK